jgi:F0F1-type ATP synthase assembly protein I
MEKEAPKNIENKPKNEPAQQSFGLADHFQITWRVASITLLSIAVFGGGGWMLDNWIGKFPLFMIIGMVISYPIAQILIYIVFKRRHNL